MDIAKAWAWATLLVVAVIFAVIMKNSAGAASILSTGGSAFTSWSTGIIKAS